MNGLDAIRKDLTEAARRAYARGIQTGSGGNLSARIPGEDLMLVKPSGGSFIDIGDADWLICDFDGNVVEGSGKATREAYLHAQLYKHTQIGAVVHCHAPWSISWAYTKQDVPMVTYHAQLKIGCAIPTLDVDTPAVTEKDMPRVIELFEKNPKLPAFLLVAHGIVAVDKTAILAEHAAELVEETAQIACMKRMLKI